MIRKSQPLPTQDLAQLYLQLSRLESSGIPIQQAMTMINQGETGKRAQVALTYLKRGKPLSEAGARAGLFVGLDATLVKVGEAGGILAEIFRQLGQFYEEKARQARKIKSRLILPVTVLVLAIFIQPFPALFLGKITIGGYLSATLGLIIKLAFIIFVFLHLWGKLEMNAPYFGRWFVRRRMRDFVQSLGLMLQAGLPILEALPKAVVENAILRQRLEIISRRLQKGDTFAQALSQVEGINPLAIQLVYTGEETGSLADMMLHYAKLESEEIARHNEMLAEWIPRIVYAGIAAWIAYGILSAGVPMSVVPEDL